MSTSRESSLRCLQMMSLVEMLNDRQVIREERVALGVVSILL